MHLIINPDYRSCSVGSVCLYLHWVMMCIRGGLSILSWCWLVLPVFRQAVRFSDWSERFVFCWLLIWMEVIKRLPGANRSYLTRSVLLDRIVIQVCMCWRQRNLLSETDGGNYPGKLWSFSRGKPNKQSDLVHRWSYLSKLRLNTTHEWMCGHNLLIKLLFGHIWRSLWWC